MGRESDAVGGASAIAQEALENPERELALCARTLMDGGGNGPGSQIRHEFGKQIRCDYSDCSGFFLALEGSQNRYGVGGGDVATDECWMISNDAQSAVGSLFRTVVGFDCREDAQMRIMARNSLAEAFDLFYVIGGGEFTGKDGHVSTLAQKSAHQIADQTAAGARIDSDGRDAVGTGGVSDNADDGNISAKSLAHSADELAGMADRGDDAI